MSVSAFDPVPRKYRSGASLVEILIAIFVFAVVLMSMMMTMLLTARNTVTAKDAENARQLALELMENCEAVKFSKNDAVYMSVISDIAKTNTNGNITAHARVAAIANHDPADLPLSADIVVEVRWRSAFGGERTYSLRRGVSGSAWQNAGERPL